MKVTKNADGGMTITLNAEEATGLEQELLWESNGNPHMEELWEAMNEDARPASNYDETTAPIGRLVSWGRGELSEPCDGEADGCGSAAGEPCMPNCGAVRTRQ